MVLGKSVFIKKLIKMKKTTTIRDVFKILWWKMKLVIASAWAEVRSEQTKFAFFVIPDEKERLLVLSEKDIIKLMEIGSIEYQNVFRLKLYKRKKNGVIKKRIRKVTRIGRKAFGITKMRRNVTYNDLINECFFYTGGMVLKDKKIDSPDIYTIDAKKKLWIDYMHQIEQRKNGKK
jgi:hypothetical protein